MSNLEYKHNKKRNVAVVYNILMKEFKKAVDNKDKSTAVKVNNIVKRYFSKGKILFEELKLYEDIMETYLMEGKDKFVVSKIILECKMAYQNLDKKRCDVAKNNLIKEVNYNLGRDFWNVKADEYKTLATIYQLFHNDLNIPQKTLLEVKLIEDIVDNRKVFVPLKKAGKDVVAVTGLMKKEFEKKYKNKLNERQYRLIHYFVNYDLDDVDFKVFLSEEISRLKKELIKESVRYEETDPELSIMFERTLRKLNELKKREIEESDIEVLLKVYEALDDKTRG